MKIAFIRPSMLGKKSKDAMKPLVFAIVKPLTPNDIEIVFYDERVEKISENINADVVAMTVETFAAKRAYTLAQKYKNEGKKVILGGHHPTMLPDEASQFADCIIVGELEDTWGEVIEDLKNGHLKERYVSQNSCNITDIKYDTAVFRGKKYSPVGLVQFSRGCRFQCEFCSVSAFFKDKIRIKSIEAVVNEIKNIKEKFLFFIDDNLFCDEKYAKELFEALIPFKKRWACQMSIDAAKNVELLKLMRKSGCTLVLIGFESLDINNLKQMGKGANIKNNDYGQIIKNIYNAGIMIYGTFVIGYDSDTKDSALNLAKFAIENKFATANFNPLMPMPGTKLYERLKAQDRLVYEKWWLDDAYSYGDAMFRPISMSEEDLAQSCKNARYYFNSYKNIFKRLLNPKVNCASFMNIIQFLVLNLVSRGEIHKKQGKKLGGIK